MNTSDSSPIQVLQSAAEGLLFPSETDAPLVPFFWPDEDHAELTPELVSTLAAVSKEATIESVTVASCFRDVTREEDWHNDEEKEQVQRFRQLVAAIKDTLEDARAFRVGETKVDVYVVGKVEGGFAGLKTQAVET